MDHPDFDACSFMATVNSEMFARLLFSRIALKDIFETVKKSRLVHHFPISVNDRAISSFREGLIFTKLRENKTLAKKSEFTVIPLV